MMKFGLFTTYISDVSQQFLETIVNYILFLLEFDESYYKEIYKNSGLHR